MRVNRRDSAWGMEREGGGGGRLVPEGGISYEWGGGGGGGGGRPPRAYAGSGAATSSQHNVFLKNPGYKFEIPIMHNVTMHCLVPNNTVITIQYRSTSFTMQLP